MRLNGRQYIGIILMLIGIILLVHVNVTPVFSLLTVAKRLTYPTIEGKLIGTTSPNSPDIIPLSKYTNVDVMVSAEGSFSIVKLRYSANGGASGEITLQKVSSSWWEEDWKGTIPSLTRGVLYELSWIGDGTTYIKSYVIFGQTSASVTGITVNGKGIQEGTKLKNKNTLKIEVAVDGTVRSVKAEIYQSVDGVWSSQAVSTVVFDNLGNGKYGKTISLGAGLYQIVIQLDYGSRTSSETVFRFYVQNDFDASTLQMLGLGLVGAGGYTVYRYREED